MIDHALWEIVRSIGELTNKVDELTKVIKKTNKKGDK